MVLIALGAALIAVASQITFPIGTVPITLQTLAVGLIASLYRIRETFFTLLLYILLGVIGLPVFSGAIGGISEIYGPTGGYLLAFLISGTLVTALLAIFQKNAYSLAIINTLGLVLTLLLGTLWLKIFTHTSWHAALLIGFLPFIAGEILKLMLIVILTKALLFSLPKVNDYFK